MQKSEMKPEFSQKQTKATKEESPFVAFACFCSKSPIRNPKSIDTTQLDDLAAGALDANGGNGVALPLQCDFGRRAILRRERRGGGQSLSIGARSGLAGGKGRGLERQRSESRAGAREEGRPHWNKSV
jgi:hypothetical protein